MVVSTLLALADMLLERSCAGFCLHACPGFSRACPQQWRCEVQGNSRSAFQRGCLPAVRAALPWPCTRGLSPAASLGFAFVDLFCGTSLSTPAVCLGWRVAPCVGPCMSNRVYINLFTLRLKKGSQPDF